MDKQEFNVGGFEVGHVSVEGGGGGDLSSFANAPMDGPPSTTTTATTASASPAGSNRDSLSLDDFEKVDAALLQQIPSHPDPLIASGSPLGSMASEEKHQQEHSAPFSAPQDSAPLTFGGTDTTTAAANTQDMLVDFMEGNVSSAVNSQVTSAASAVQDLLGDFSGSDKGRETASSTLMEDFAPPQSFAAPAPAMFSMEPPTVVPPSPPAVGVELDPYTVFSQPVDSHDDDDDDDFNSAIIGYTSEPVHEDHHTSVNEPAPPVREPSAPPREPTPTKEPSFSQPKEPTPPPRTPSPPPKPKEPTPPPREPTPTREPSPPIWEPTPPPKEPTPPPKEPTPPPKEPTPPPRVPTPPRREPTPPPREPTPPPREPTPPPREPTPPKQPTPKQPISPPKEPTPPREPTPAQSKDSTPPPQLVPIGKSSVEEVPQQKTNKARRTNKLSDSTRASMAIFDPRAWFQPKALHPIVLDLIYWRNVKITTAVVCGCLGLLIALAYVSFISILAYTSLATLTVTIAYRIYKNIVQAIQKSSDGHPFKEWLAADTSIPIEKMHDASDVFVDQFNAFLAEMKRLFLVEDLVDSIKFGCLLWCLTYVGYWFNGLTLFIIHLVAMFSLPKIYEVNKTQVDYHVGFLRNWAGDLLGKVKGAIPIGKEKAQ